MPFKQNVKVLQVLWEKKYDTFNLDLIDPNVLSKKFYDWEKSATPQNVQ